MMKSFLLIGLSFFFPNKFMYMLLAFMFLLLGGNHFCVKYNLMIGMGWDHFSFLLSLLTIWIVMLMILSTNSKEFDLHNLLVFLCLVLLITFCVTSPIKFYIFFEFSLIPTLVIILGWGVQPERIKAGVYFTLYTMVASLPFLVFLCNLSLFTNSMLQSLYSPFSSSVTALALIGLMVFMVKLPLYGVHLWLIKAHVEAPVVGSMILASILLKLGGFGLFRVLKWFSFCFSPSLLVWGLMMGVYASIVCVSQSDVKVLIALSSVCHMAMVFGAIMSFSMSGFNGASVIMVGHGFCSSGLFYLANLSYMRSSSRSFEINKGQSVFGVSLFLWILLSSLNMAVPPSINLLGEITSILGLLLFSKFNIIFVSCLCFMAAGYSLTLFLNMNHGVSKKSESMSSSKVNEIMIVLLHWIPANLLILSDSFLISFF